MTIFEKLWVIAMLAIAAFGIGNGLYHYGYEAGQRDAEAAMRAKAAPTAICRGG